MQPDETNIILSGRGLTKVFGFGARKTIAVDHVDFDFRAGEVVSIVGESGSGKTTLAKNVAGLNQLYRGRNILLRKKA